MITCTQKTLIIPQKCIDTISLREQSGCQQLDVPSSLRFCDENHPYMQ
jgi:hypothetical protein